MLTSVDAAEAEIRCPRVGAREVGDGSGDAGEGKEGSGLHEGGVMSSGSRRETRRSEGLRTIEGGGGTLTGGLTGIIQHRQCRE